jgi:uncharacterized protein YkwD
MTMTTRTDGKIRPIVWLMGLAPFVVVAAVFAYLLLPDKKPMAQRPAAATAPPVEPLAPAALPQAPPPIALPSAASALPSAAPSGTADERAEIDALLVRPPGSEQWTVDQKNAYRAQLSQDLRGRERKLEWDIAAAHRSRDRATEQAKTETLAHLRQVREVLEGPLPAPSGAALPADAGLAD